MDPAMAAWHQLRGTVAALAWTSRLAASTAAGRKECLEVEDTLHVKPCDPVDS